LRGYSSFGRTKEKEGTAAVRKSPEKNGQKEKTGGRFTGNRLSVCFLYFGAVGILRKAGRRGSFDEEQERNVGTE